MDSDLLEQNLFLHCKTCQICCKGNVPVGICNYSIIESIEKNKIPRKLVEKLVIYSVSKERMDEMALHWWHFPENNILYDVTLESDGFFEFLAVPFALNECIFLTDTGCLYADLKPFDCGIFPFHFEKKTLIIDEWCEIFENSALKEEIYTFYEKKTKDLTTKYEKYCLDHKEEYFHGLNRIRET